MSRGKSKGPESTRVALLGALQLADGEVSDAGGHAAVKLARLAHVDHFSSQTLRAHLAGLEQTGNLSREVRGHKTFAIRLRGVPDADRIGVARWIAQRGNGKKSPPVETPAPQRTTGPSAAAVADALLAAVLDIASKPDQLQQSQRRLSDVLAEADGLRVRLRLAESELVAVKHERDGLRQRLRIAEANAQAAIGDNSRVVDAEVTKRLATFMAAKPEPSRLARNESDDA